MADFFFQAIKVASDQKNKEQVAKQEKEKELSKVKISKEDVDLIVCTVLYYYNIRPKKCLVSVNPTSPTSLGPTLLSF